jgi:hypothetical protein
MTKLGPIVERRFARDIRRRINKLFIISAVVAVFLLVSLFFFATMQLGTLALWLWARDTTPIGDVTFTLHFPEEVSLGELWMAEDQNCMTCGSGEEYLGKAVGTHNIRLPASHWYVRLMMPKDAAQLMPYLRNESLKNIGAIDLAGSDITDNDLQYLSNLNLERIDLSKTNITGSGLQNLKPHDDWIFVYLNDSNNLDLNYLTHFRGWQRSSIIVTSYMAPEYKPSDSDKLKKARQVICDDLPEDICGVQIR